MKMLVKVIGAALVALTGASGANAATVVCGDSNLGLRTTTVDPALAGSCYAGLQNLGDTEIESLINTKYSILDADLLDRDTANTNGGLLGITGVGGAAGGWSIASSVWADYNRIFLYFHFGDGPDKPSTTSTTDPEVFIVELLRPDNTGTWIHFDGVADGKTKYGLSNIALIRSGEGPGCTVDCNPPPPPPPPPPPQCGGPGQPECVIPEPGSLALVSVALLGLFAGLRRRRNA